MKCIVGTLFEHHYHIGVAALVNSLCRGGYKGAIYAGFRGALPPWAAGRARAVKSGQWEMPVTPEVRLVFLELETPAHFTNYKPEFLLQLETLTAGESDAVIYCDPDLVLNGKWSYVEEWLTCGIAVCEDVNSPLGLNHPRRIGWRRFFGALGFQLRYSGPEYANGGFIGVPWKHRTFLLTWKDFIARVAESLGGVDIVGIAGGRRLKGNYGFADCFRQPDQDALNAALEAHPEIPVSFLGQAAMGFEPGHSLLPHALGSSKPWRRQFVREALKGRPPRAVDKAFWREIEGPIRPYQPSEVFWRRLRLSIASALGRIVRRA
jgi:hypothetical protein